MNNKEQRFQIHYYFNDDSHSMNAFVRNKAEKDLLEAVQQVGSILECEFTIESEAYTEGGLVETLALIGIPTTATLHYLSPAINQILIHYFTKDADDKKLKELDIQIKEETLKKLQLDNIQNKDKQILEDKQAIRYISNFYTKINHYEKVQKIGFRSVNDNSQEYIVDRKYFPNFILEENKEIYEDENAVIEIISPILKEGKYKWKGIYNGEKIDFSMGDYAFKKEVIEGKHTFINGSFIECKLQITVVYDDFGDEKRRSYSVKEVYSIQELPTEQLKLTKLGKKRQREKQQGSLFDFSGEKDE
ncbi:MAG: hypothetical protein LGB70_06750 [Sulfurovum sp.]|nr:hypothetical protein [Sulfurovum sp.]MCB4782525.1 hypothetical protein [Sulfurovum sp.]